jgi:hypothetical protein
MQITQEQLKRMGTRLTAEYLIDLTVKNPAILLPNGNVRLPPARLSFAWLGKPQPNKKEPQKPGRFNANLLFLPMADLTALATARNEMVKAFFPNNPQGVGLYNGFKNQADRVGPLEGGLNKKGQTTTGYVPGWPYIAPTANRQPSLSVFAGGQPQPFFGTVEEIEKTFYSGCWVIPSVNCYHGKSTENPGIMFGLQGVLKIADDEAFTGTGGVDAATEYAGVAIESNMQPSALFDGGQGAAQAQQPVTAASLY